MWLSRCHGNSEPSDAPPKLAISALVQAAPTEMLPCTFPTAISLMNHFIRAPWGWGSSLVAEATYIYPFPPKESINSNKVERKECFRGAASAVPTWLLSVKLAPEWARGFIQRQRHPPYFNKTKLSVYLNASLESQVCLSAFTLIVVLDPFKYVQGQYSGHWGCFTQLRAQVEHQLCKKRSLHNLSPQNRNLVIEIAMKCNPYAVSKLAFKIYVTPSKAKT
eukprot:6186520-Pleurochrysis_carterae.AAC.3